MSPFSTQQQIILQEYVNASMDIIPCITLWQPWATWVIKGWKTIETRTHSRFRNLTMPQLGIHAGEMFDAHAARWAAPFLTQSRIDSTGPGQVPQGAVLGNVKSEYIGQLSRLHSKKALIDCQGTKRFGLRMRDPWEYIRPSLCQGSQGIWYFNTSTGKRATREQYLAQFSKQLAIGNNQ